jgi:hypothetical protein
VSLRPATAAAGCTLPATSVATFGSGSTASSVCPEPCAAPPTVTRHVISRPAKAGPPSCVVPCPSTPSPSRIGIDQWNVFVARSS